MNPNPCRASALARRYPVAAVCCPAASRGACPDQPAGVGGGQAAAVQPGRAHGEERADDDQIVMTVPAGFGIDSFVPPPAGWQMQCSRPGPATAR